MNQEENFITVAPKDKIIGKYISCYYFHSSKSAEYSRKFRFYPNYRHGVTVYNNCDVSFNQSGSVIRPSDENRSDVFYTINTSQSFSVDIKGCFTKIGIVFNPLGINNFLDKPLGEVFNEAVNTFPHFGPLFEQTALTVFNEPDTDEKIKYLDSFFLANFYGFNELLVKKALQQLLNTGGTIKVDELADVLQTSRKTLLRQFKKHLCCSIEEYKKMVMFRNALEYSQQQKDSSVTDVALYSLYYDQAHYIKHFKAVTKLSPKALLSHITPLGGGVYWNFED